MKKEIKKVESKYVWKDSDLSLVNSDVPIEKLPQIIKEKIKRIAELNNLPPTGITILGGRIYVNRTGLDTRLKRKEVEEGRRVKRIQSYPIERPNPKNNYLAGFKCVIEFEDNQEREKKRAEVVIEAVKNNKSPEEIEKILEVSGLTPPIYSAEGWCSPKSAKAIAYEYQYSEEQQKKVPSAVLVENIIMMAETKAQNRTIRLATGTGITSLEEVLYSEPEEQPKREEVKKPTIDIDADIFEKKEGDKK